jgi:DNA phosphorothioation-dependent restriction protein DptH
MGVPSSSPNVVVALAGVLEGTLVRAVNRDSGARRQVVIHGVPDEILQDLFLHLTRDGTTNWAVGTAQGQQDVVVLYVVDDPAARNIPTPAVEGSRVCGWDYVVNARNSWPLLVVLVSPVARAARPDSIANATESLGPPGVGELDGLWESPLWTGVVDQLVAQLAAAGIAGDAIRWGLRRTLRESGRFPPDDRREAPWLLAADLMRMGVGPTQVYAALGFPPPATEVLDRTSLEKADEILSRLAEFLRAEGLRDGVVLLKSTPNGQNPGIASALEGLEAHLASRLAEGLELSDDTHWTWRVDPPIPAWWLTLTSAVLDRLLHDVGSAPPSTRIRLSVANALNGNDRLSDEPFLVQANVELVALNRDGQRVLASSFTRGTATTATSVPTDPVDSSKGLDQNVPPHDRKRRYRAIAAGYEPGTVDVIVLDKFGCRGTARIRHSLSNPPPDLDATTGFWNQSITLDMPGTHEVEVRYSGAVDRATLTHGGPAIPSSAHHTGFDLFVIPDLEAGETAEIQLLSTSVGQVGTWTIGFVVDQTDSPRPPSQFDALVRAHQAGKSNTIAPAPRPSPLRRIEDFILSDQASWKPVLAGWSSTTPLVGPINWGDARMGDLRPASDPRPPGNPPAPLIRSRDAIRSHIAARRQSIPEVEFSDPALSPLVSEYLKEYMVWLRANPADAVWFDCIAIYGPIPNLAAGPPSATAEPIAILLNPLHPLRLAWHHVAQGRLVDSLQTPCPAAGMLDPHRCPEVMALPVFRGGGTLSWRAFVGMGSGEPNWALLLNKGYLGSRVETKAVFDVLIPIGFSPRSMGGGFSESQTTRTLEEVATILPGRATLRVGLVGKDRGGSSAVNGILRWSKDRFEGDTSRLVGPRSIEIHDARAAASDPSAGQLDQLHEQTGESVRWYRHDPGSLGNIRDLTIVDHLSVDDPQVASAPSCSPMSRGGLYRIRIREDFEDAGVLRESRIGVATGSGSNLERALESAITEFEGIARQDGGASHVQFQPNQDALKERLDQSLFVAVSSNKLDPACFVRGVRLHHGYLWDFEVPGLLGGEEDGAGFYLVARATQSMAEAVLNATRLVTPTPPPAEQLLLEISKRGIPVLKRLAAGGTRSKGELGVLLAVRFLQDAFAGPVHAVRLPPWNGPCMNLVIPVDSFDDTFARLSKALGRRAQLRPDLLVINIQVLPDRPVRLRVIPVEVKFRDSPMDNTALLSAQTQASTFGRLLQNLWVDPPPTDLWRDCSLGLLASMLDQAFRVYADPTIHRATAQAWTTLHQSVLLSVLGGNAQLDVDSRGRVLAFDRSVATAPLDLDGDGFTEALRVSGPDSALLLSHGNASPELDAAFAALGFSLPGCPPGPPTPIPSAGPTSVAGSEPAPEPTAVIASRPPPPRPDASTPTIGGLSRSGPPERHVAPVPPRPAPAVQNTGATPPPLSTSPSHRPESERVGNLPLAAAHPIPETRRPPRLMTGWRAPTNRWAVVGKMPDTGEPVALDMDNPKVIGVFGYMGSGKSYLLGDIIETAVSPIDGLNALAHPLAVVIFNYRRAASDRFEWGSLVRANNVPDDVARLSTEYSTTPRGLTDVRVLCLPSQLNARQAGEYRGLQSSELFFRPDLLEVEDWELLMGQPGSDAVFAQVIRHSLRELRGAGPINLDALERNVTARLTGQSRHAAELRFALVRQFVSHGRGIDFAQVVAPGRVTIIDLRDPLFNRDDALRFFLVCANSLARVQGSFNRMVVFDEAQEYMSDVFAELLNARIRLMRHEGTTYVFATQDVASIPLDVRRFLTTRFVFDLGTTENVTDLTRLYSEFEGLQLRSLRPGHCLLQDNNSIADMFQQPRMIRVRPRVTEHGGTSRIFSAPGAPNQP